MDEEIAHPLFPGCDEKSLNAQRVSVESDDIPVLRNKRRVNAGHESAHSGHVTQLQPACDENTIDQRVAGSEHDLLIGSNSNTPVVSNDMQVHHSGSEGQQESQFERMIEVPMLQASNDIENQDALERSRESESEGCVERPSLIEVPVEQQLEEVQANELTI
ncbi:hypothetical protein V6N11_071264 [Hibiscus sabdariffa]|uniref:Uncharacterized protein n=1 Tax=Hibiscus sabdariffa TaxID=183260 RepID=A0ABR2TZJ9_9ROSI